MVYRSLWRNIGAVWLMLGLLAPAVVAQPKEGLTWLLRDLPPLTIFEGSQKGQGAIDRLMPLLIESMPQYEHSLLRVNRARGMQMLLEPSFTCDPALVWTPERAKAIVFSIPFLGMHSNGLIVRRQDHALIEPYVMNGHIDLIALLNQSELKLGVIAQRSYGMFIDSQLKQATAGRLSAHYGNDALGSLLQMQRLSRLGLMLGYWPEVRYRAQQLGIATQDLEFYPIAGNAKYQFIRVGCSDTAQGHEAIARINVVLRQLREEQAREFYLDWLAPRVRDEYRHDAMGFFKQPADQ